MRERKYKKRKKGKQTIALLLTVLLMLNSIEIGATEVVEGDRYLNTVVDMTDESDVKQEGESDIEKENELEELKESDTIESQDDLQDISKDISCKFYWMRVWLYRK